MKLPDPDSLLLVGRVQRPHGVLGEVKVVPATDDPDRLLELERVYLGAAPDAVRFAHVRSARMQPGKKGLRVLMTLTGVEGREEAEALQGIGVYAHEDDLPELEEGEVFLHDLIGLSVVLDADGAAVGTVKDILSNPAQDLLVVARDGQPDVLIPDVDEIVVLVDFDAEEIRVDPPEGLLD